MPGRFFGGEEVAEQVDVHHGAPLLGGELGDFAGDQDAGVGHQDVQPAELLDRPGESGLDRGLVGDVHHDRQAAAAGFLHDQVGRGLRLLQLDVGHGDVAALVGQPQTDRLPKTLCAAGDERDVICRVCLTWVTP